ncbi:MAG: hypothetical protein CMF51_03340 [Legionellales bacterium]|nr:hypothetical protein [Legionellales bacterium]
MHHEIRLNPLMIDCPYFDSFELTYRMCYFNGQDRLAFNAHDGFNDEYRLDWPEVLIETRSD